MNKTEKIDIRVLREKNIGRVKETVKSFSFRYKDRFGVWRHEECVAVKGNACEGCVLSIRDSCISGGRYSDYTEALLEACDKYACTSLLRSDGRDVVFVKKEKEKDKE